MKPKILLISAISPFQKRGGGAVVLARHLLEQQDFEFMEFRPKSVGSLIGALVPKRLFKTRLSGWLNCLFHNTWPIVPKPDQNRIKNFDPHVVLTVAHGPEAWMAQRVARRLRLPFVSIFHDWWPFLALNYYRPSPTYLEKIRRDFIRLYQESDCALCVCEGMKEHLGTHHNSIVLYPAPSVAPLPWPGRATESLRSKLAAQNPIRIVYAGNMTGGYGSQLRELYGAIKKQDKFELRLVGNTSDWPAQIRNSASSDGTLSPHLPFEDLLLVLNEGDLLLVNMGFDAEAPIFLETSFPSKISSYAFINKPIAYWGPKSSSIIRFAETNKLQFACTSKSSQDLLQFLEDQINVVTETEIEKDNETLRKLFDPTSLQNVLIDAVVGQIDRSTLHAI